MRVLVTGAYGFIGSHVCARLYRAGHEIVGAGRAVAEARLRYPHIKWIACDFSRDTDIDVWLPRLAGIDAVVNCVGVLQAGPGRSPRKIQVEGTAALVAACEEAGMRRVVHISAVGAEAAAGTAFAATKEMADNDLKGRALDWVILKPSLVVARNAYGGTGLIRAIAGFPLVMPVIEGMPPLQPVHMDDVTETVAFFLRPEAPAGLELALAGPEPRTLTEIVTAYRRWLGFKPAPVVKVPRCLARPMFLFGDLAGWLGWENPARSTLIRQLAFGLAADPDPWRAATGIRPKSLEAALAAEPAGVQDRWHARCYFLKPLILLCLAAVFVATGIIALGPGAAEAAFLLTQAGFDIRSAQLFGAAGALADIALGLLVLVRRSARLALRAMLALMAFYLAALSLWAPGLWFDPLGPAVKMLPLIVLIAAAIALEEKR